MGISKRDAFHMSGEQQRAGQDLWKVTGQVGRLASSSFNAEERAPKTWILWANEKGEEIATIECELYSVPRASDTREQIGMLIGMCPKCGNNFTVREDNKAMTLDRVSYRKAPKFLRANWAYHCRNVLGKPPMDDDVLPLVSSPERWACDYCKEWCVRVSAGVAVMDMTGVTQLTVASRPPIVGQRR